MPPDCKWATARPQTLRKNTFGVFRPLLCLSTVPQVQASKAADFQERTLVHGCVVMQPAPTIMDKLSPLSPCGAQTTAVVSTPLARGCSLLAPCLISSHQPIQEKKSSKQTGSNQGGTA